MHLLMGLLSALCWGGTDYLSGKAARELGVFKALFVSQLFGLMMLSLIFFIFSIPFELKISGLLTAAIASFCNLLGMVFFAKSAFNWESFSRCASCFLVRRSNNCARHYQWQAGFMDYFIRPFFVHTRCLSCQYFTFARRKKRIPGFRRLRFDVFAIAWAGILAAG